MPAAENVQQWDLDGFRNDILSQFGVKLDVAELRQMSRQELEDSTLEHLMRRYQEKEDLIGSDIMRQTERLVMLQVIDDQWKDHLLSMDHLKEGIGLQGYGQKDPLVEYKKEGFDLFQSMMERVEDESIRYLFFLQVQQGERPPLPFPEEDEYEEEEEDSEPTWTTPGGAILHSGFHAEHRAEEG